MTKQVPKVKKTADEVKADLEEANRKVDNRIKRHNPTRRQQLKENKET
jgi:hypothetical protein